MALSPDGKRIALLGDFDPCAVIVMDASTGQRLARCPVPFTGLTLAFSPNGKYLAVAGFEDHVSFFDCGTGKLVSEVDVGDALAGVFHVAYDSSGKLLAFCGHNEVRVVELATNHLLMRKPLWGATRCAFSSDGKCLLTADQQGLHVWEVQTGKPCPLLPDARDVSTVWGVSPNGRFVALGGQGTEVWDTATGKRLLRIPWPEDSPPRFAVFTRDSTRVVCGEPMAMYEISSGKRLFSFEDHPRAVRCEGDGLDDGWPYGVLSLDGQTLFSFNSNQVLRWNARNGKAILNDSEPAAAPISIAFSKDSKRLVAGFSDRSVYLWELASASATVQLRPPLKAPNIPGLPTRPVRLIVGEIRSPAERVGLPAVVAKDNTLVAWVGGEIVQCENSREMKRGAAPFGAPHKLLVDAHNRLMAVGVATQRPKGIAIWRDGASKPLSLADAPSDGVISLSSNGSMVAAGMLDGSWGVWRVPSGQKAWQFDTCEPFTCVKKSQNYPITKMAFSPDGRTLATADTIELTFREAITLEERCDRLKPSAGIYAFAWSPDGRTIATAGYHSCVELWDFISRKKVQLSAGTGADITCVGFSPDGKLLAVGSTDTSVTVWSVADKRFPGPSGGKPLSSTEVEWCWEALASGSAREAFQAICQLAGHPNQAIALFDERLPPIRAPAPAKVAEWLRALDADDFSVRQDASNKLENLADVVESALRDALATNPSAESRRRISEILRGLNGPVRPHERKRALRAVEVLEKIGTSQARTILERLATGEPAAVLTQEAKASLGRMSDGS
jgi:WD40 repeat protein